MSRKNKKEREILVGPTYFSSAKNTIPAAAQVAI